MKKGTEYLKNVTAFTTREELYNIGKQIQIETIEEAVKLCAEIGVTFLWMNNRDFNIVGDVAREYSEDLKEEILKCIKILKEKL